MADWVGESRVAVSRAARRAEWLAELAAAVEHAQLLLWDLAAMDRVSPATRALYGELESVRVEIDGLRGVGVDDSGNRQLDQWLAMLGEGGLRLSGSVKPLGASPRHRKTR